MREESLSQGEGPGDSDDLSLCQEAAGRYRRIGQYKRNGAPLVHVPREGLPLPGPKVQLSREQLPLAVDHCRGGGGCF